MPITGNILEINPEIDSAPELVNEDPYGKGWLIRIKLANPSDAEGLLTADQYKEEVGL